MEIPLQAQVECTDGVCGKSAYILVNPVTEKVTHLVVSEAASPYTEYIIPFDLVSESADGKIHILCSMGDLEKMVPFNKTIFIEEKVPDYAGNRGYGVGAAFYWPYVSPDLIANRAVEDQQIPAGEISVCRGTRVEGTDGYVGKVDEFVVNPENGRINHLVMREGHLWGQKDVIIPVSAIGDTNEETVFLKLDKHLIESLPTFPLHRHWS